MLSGYLNSYLKVHTALIRPVFPFTQALREGTETYKEASQLDQMCTRTARRTTGGKTEVVNESGLQSINGRDGLWPSAGTSNRAESASRGVDDELQG